MKKLLLFSLLIVTSFVFGQNDVLFPMSPTGTECGTQPVGPVIKYTQSQLTNARFSTNNTQYVLNVFVHYIDNIVPSDQQEEATLNIVGALNYDYDGSNIFFKYTGYENIPNPDYLDINTDDKINILGNVYSNDTRIDIFVTQTINSSAMLGVTWTWHPVGNPNVISKKIIAIRSDVLPQLNSAIPTNDEFARRTLPHEIGHYLGLYHTHQRWRYNAQNELETVTDGYTGCDALEENLDGSQWDILGDLIQDTNPDRILSHYGLSYFYPSCIIDQTGYHPDNCGNTIDFNS